MNTELPVFCQNSNNNVLGVMTEQDHDKVTEWLMSGMLDEYSRPIVKVFTFVEAERLRDEPWHTGDLELYRKLTAHGVVINRDFVIPLSNGETYGLLQRGAFRLIFSSIGNISDAIEAFGLRFAPAPVHIASA